MSLEIPDLCARLDRLKVLCDALEGAQNDRKRYRDLILLIRAETDAFRETVCSVQPKEPAFITEAPQQAR
jgi:hypothetical protein